MGYQHRRGKRWGKQGQGKGMGRNSQGAPRGLGGPGWRGGRGAGMGQGMGRGWGRGRMYMSQPVSPLPPPPPMTSGPGVTQSLNPLPPPPPNVLRVVVPTMGGGGLNDVVSTVFARSPYFTIVDIADGSPVNVTAIPNPYMYTGGGVGVMIGQWLIASNTHVVLAPSLGPNILSLLQSSGIRYIPVQPGIRVLDALRSAGLIK